ncbi:MAG: hypothetical protein P8Y70_20005 [Candidatus Lokiarchaeota archaeon]
MNNSKMFLFKITINKSEKDRFLITLAEQESVHIKPKEGEYKGEAEEEKSKQKKIKNLKDNLETLYKKLEITESDLKNLKIKPEERVTFKVKDMEELINHITEEINFYQNRANELERYIVKANIELESIELIRDSYSFLNEYNFNRLALTKFKQLNLKVYTTFSKNLANFKDLFSFSEFPNVYEYQNISEERIAFFTVYPKDKEEDLRKRINIVHAEEVPILKKYLTSDGINFSRITKEIDLINKTLFKYRKEINRIRDDNIIKFGAMKEVIENIDKYNNVQDQFREISNEKLELEFFVPSDQKKKVDNNLKEEFGEQIQIKTTKIKK